MQVLNITVDHIFLACGFTDMRKSVDGLAAIVQQNFQLDPFSNNLFIFCGRRHDRLKALLWRGDGFLLLYKRLLLHIINQEDSRYYLGRLPLM